MSPDLGHERRCWSHERVRKKTRTAVQAVHAHARGGGANALSEMERSEVSSNQEGIHPGRRAGTRIGTAVDAAAVVVILRRWGGGGPARDSCEVGERKRRRRWRWWRTGVGVCWVYWKTRKGAVVETSVESGRRQVEEGEEDEGEEEEEGDEEEEEEEQRW